MNRIFLLLGVVLVSACSSVEEQKRPNIHIEDMTNLYLFLLKQPVEKVHRKIYNAGYENYRVKDIARMIRQTLDREIKIVTTSTDDNRSYHVSSEKIKKELGFVAGHRIEEAVRDLEKAFRAGLIPDPMSDIRYFNIKTMPARPPG